MSTRLQAHLQPTVTAFASSSTLWISIRMVAKVACVSITGVAGRFSSVVASMPWQSSGRTMLPVTTIHGNCNDDNAVYPNKAYTCLVLDLLHPLRGTLHQWRRASCDWNRPTPTIGCRGTDMDRFDQDIGCIMGCTSEHCLHTNTRGWSDHSECVGTRHDCSAR